MKNFTVEFDRFRDAMESDEQVGWCRECGEEHFEIEPDAESYECNACGTDTVYGRDIYALSGWIDC